MIELASINPFPLASFFVFRTYGGERDWALHPAKERSFAFRSVTLARALTKTTSQWQRMLQNAAMRQSRYCAKK